MRRVSSFVLLAALFAVLAAGPAGAVPYSVEIERPGADALREPLRGELLLRVAAAGLVLPERAAARLAPPGEGWDQAAATTLRRAGDHAFVGSFDTESLPNGIYRLLVRAWGGIAREYDPDDGGSYAAATATVRVGNPPEAPARVSASGLAGGVRLSWAADPTARRSDFAGYRLLVAETSGACPPPGPRYAARGITFETTRVEPGLEPGRYCFRVVALRTTPGVGTVASPPSEPATAEVRPGALADEGSDEETYTSSLPYGPMTEASPIAVEPLTGVEPAPAGDQRSTLTHVAAGMLLMVTSVLLRRYLTAPRRSSAVRR